MFSLRKLLGWGSDSSREQEKRGFILDAAEREKRPMPYVLFGAIVLIGIGIIAVWIVSLVSPTFDLTPTELGRSEQQSEHKGALDDLAEGVTTLTTEIQDLPLEEFAQ